MATTQEQLDGLNQAIADGVRQVTIGGETTVFNTTDSLIRARDDVLARLRAEQGAATPRAKVSRLYYAGRGY
jgi:hypothetical protein